MSVAPHVVVAVPARDEEARIAAALAAITAAADRLLALHPSATVTVVVAADACTDATAAIARDAGAVVVEIAHGRVGAARAAAIDLGLTLDPDACWIANTDADSRAPTDWLVTHLAAERDGVDLLLGSVRPDVRELGSQRFLRWLRLNPPREDHRYIHGANLGIRASTYRLLGGFPDVAADEDVQLVGRGRSLGARVRSTDRDPMTTSARTRGRTPSGFSDHIRALSLLDDQV